MGKYFSGLIPDFVLFKAAKAPSIHPYSPKLFHPFLEGWQ
jgi:hypothetical protein